MKNKRGYDHRAAIRPNTMAAYDLGYSDGYQGAECFPEGSEHYRAGWRHGREFQQIEREDEGYCAGLFSTLALEDHPTYLTNCAFFVRGWHRGRRAQQTRQAS